MSPSRNSRPTCARRWTPRPEDMEAAGTADFGAGRLFLADARLGLIGLNWARHWALHRAFGVSRAQANALSVVLALSAAEAGATAARRVIQAPLRISGSDVATGGLLVREAALGIAGPQSRDLPLFITLVVVGATGAAAL